MCVCCLLNEFHIARWFRIRTQSGVTSHLVRLPHSNKYLNFAISYDFVQNLYKHQQQHIVWIWYKTLCIANQHTHKLIRIYWFVCVSGHQVNLTYCCEQRRQPKKSSERINIQNELGSHMCGNPHCFCMHVCIVWTVGCRITRGSYTIFSKAFSIIIVCHYGFMCECMTSFVVCCITSTIFALAHAFFLWLTISLDLNFRIDAFISTFFVAFVAVIAFAEMKSQSIDMHF